MPWGKCLRAEQIQLCEHGDVVCISYPPDSGYRCEWRQTLRQGHMQKRACDEWAIIGSRRLRKFFIFAIERGYQQSEWFNLLAATNTGQMVKRQSYCGVCQIKVDSLPVARRRARSAPADHRQRLLVEFLCLNAIVTLKPKRETRRVG